MLKRVTISKRMRAKLREVKAQLKRRRHLPIPEQGQWLGSVVRGPCSAFIHPVRWERVCGAKTRDGGTGNCSAAAGLLSGADPVGVGRRSQGRYAA
jgi:hypothetical protein